MARRAAADEPQLNPYVAELVQGVVAYQVEIDELLNTYSLGWSLDRMPSVDRCALRIGAFEVLFNADVPEEVAIAEAVALVAEHSTDESPAFVNGLLARIAKIKSRIVPADSAAVDTGTNP
jgi:N utilization substance protein B